jgi:hypothetical protein
LRQLEELDVRLLSKRTGVAVFWKDILSSATELTMAPGEYDLLVEPSHVIVTCGTGMGPRSRLWRGPTSTSLRLAPGEERRLVVTPWDGGRVRVHLDLPDDAGERARGGAPLDHDELVALLEPPGGPGAAVSEIADDGTLRVLDLYLEDTGKDHMSLPRMLPGTSAVSETLLRPGTRTLLVEAPGFAPQHVRVLVHANEVVDARVRLRPRE